MQTKYIGILIFILILFIIFNINKENYENMDSKTSEAISNLSSMYNSGKVYANNLEIMNDAIIKGKIDIEKDISIGNDAKIAGNVSIKKNIVVDGDGTMTNIKTNSISPINDNSLIIGDDTKDLILKRKYYVMEGIDSYNGDLWRSEYNDTENAIKMCSGVQQCDRFYNEGDTYWMKNANNIEWLIGSTEWPKDIFFSGNFENKQKGTALGPASSFNDCYDKAKEQKFKYFNYHTHKNNKNNTDNCRAINKGDRPGKTIFIKKF
jgi:hypothetical protein